MCIRRSVDGGYLLIRDNNAKRAEFNKTLQYVGDNKWLPRNKGQPLNYFKNMFSGVCYIVGKGPSLDSVAVENFTKDAPIFCLNHSIHVIEKLFNHCAVNTFCVQQDASVKDECIPKCTGIHLLSVNAQGWNPNAVLYDSANFGEHTGVISAVAAIKLAKFMGCTEFKLLAFDAMKNKNTDYAKCLHRKPFKPQLFLKHKELILRALGDSKHEIL